MHLYEHKAVQILSGDANNQIWRFGWIRMSSDDPNLVSFKTEFGERFIGEEWNLAWWVLFLSPILGIPKFLRDIPGVNTS
jgi:hypothetical protein